MRNGSERTLTFRISANGADQIYLVAPGDSKIRSAGAPESERPIDQGEDGEYSISCSGRSCDGAILRLTTDRLRPIRFLVAGSSPGLPPSAAGLVAARPELARPQYNPDASITFTHLSL